MTEKELLLIKEAEKEIKKQERINREIQEQEKQIDIRFNESMRRLSLLL